MKVPDGYKRCKCRDDDGRELGAQCPRLKRRTGTWSASHGTWYGQADLPVPDGQPRARLRAGGFASQDGMRAWFTAAIRLLEIPEAGPHGHAARLEILALVNAAREAKADLPVYDDLRRRYAEGVAFKPGEAGAFLLGWLDGHEAAGHWSKSTALENRRIVKGRLIPALGHIDLDRLRAKHVYDMFDAIDAESARVTAAKASPDPGVRKSVAGKRPTGVARKQRILAVLRSALADACSQEDRLVTVNVAAGVRFGRQRKGTGGSQRTKPRLWTAEREKAWRAAWERRSDGLDKGGRYREWLRTSARPGPVMVWRPEHLGRFLDQARAEGHRMYPLFCLYAYCALRRSEGLGLRWEETDLDSGSVMAGVVTVVQVGWEVEEQQGAKTGESEDWAHVPAEVAGPLRSHRRAQSAERLAWGPAWTDTGYCFTHEDGTLYHPNEVSDQFERVAFRAGLPPVTLRDVRHCAPTFALRSGTDIKLISAMMRHASVKTTADLYAIVLPELSAEVSDAVAAAIPRAAR